MIVDRFKGKGVRLEIVAITFFRFDLICRNDHVSVIVGFFELFEECVGFVVAKFSIINFYDELSVLKARIFDSGNYMEACAATTILFNGIDDIAEGNFATH